MKMFKEIKDIFENELDNLDVFFRLLSNYYGVKLYEGESLIIFDEIQKFFIRFHFAGNIASFLFAVHYPFQTILGWQIKEVNDFTAF